jgi:hypothetical protein
VLKIESSCVQVSSLVFMSYIISNDSRINNGDFSRACLKSYVAISPNASSGAEGAPWKYKIGADIASAPWNV